MCTRARQMPLSLLLCFAVAGALAQDIAAEPAPGKPQARAADAAQKKLYTVVDGYKVDAETYQGFKAWRAGGCDRCHGANQQGLVGPSLIESLKTLSKEDFIQTVTNGRLDKGMQRFADSPTVMGHINQLYAYLKGRSDGAITRARVEEIKP